MTRSRFLDLLAYGILWTLLAVFVGALIWVAIFIDAAPLIVIGTFSAVLWASFRLLNNKVGGWF